MPINYQNRLNQQIGALGPKQPALWKNLQVSDGPVYSMKAAPLVFSPVSGNYVTAYNTPQEAQASISFFGKQPVRRMFFTKGHDTKKPLKFGKFSQSDINMYNDLDFGESLGFGRAMPRRTKKTGKSVKKRKKKTKPPRWSYYKKWTPPRKVTSRRKMLKKCGDGCFMIPDPKNPKFPICNPDCTTNVHGVHAAYVRARQWGYDDIARKAEKKLKSMGVSVKKHKRKSKRKRSRKKKGRRSRRK